MRITYAAARSIAGHAADQAPREACGLLAGKGGFISLALPVANAAAQPEAAFTLAPAEQLRQLKRIDALGLDCLGVYHSHPRTPPIPSPADLAGTGDTGLLQLIVSLASPRPRLKLWRIAGASALALELDFAGAPSSDDDTGELTQKQQLIMLAAGALSLLALLVIAIALLPAVG